MKIACVTTSVIPSRSANSIQAMKVVHALRELGHEVQLWVPDFGKSEWEKIAELYGLTTPFEIKWLRFIPLLKQYDFAWKSVSAAKRWGAKVIYTWALQTAVFSQLRGVPIVMEFHDFPMGRVGPELFKFYAASHGKKLTLCTTRALAKGIEERFGIQFSSSELQIAPNGTAIERYINLPSPEDTRKALGLPQGFTIGYTGHFYAGRGMGLLTEIAKKMPEINFLWAGGREEDITSWQADLGKRSINNITITGFIPNSRLPLYQAAADALVMPYGKQISGSSGGDISQVINPMKMFDYMASGRPIIASNIPVFHEILHKEISIFCEPEQPEDWINAIRQVQENPAQRQKMGQLAKKEAERYTWKNRARHSLEKLEEILK